MPVEDRDFHIIYAYKYNAASKVIAWNSRDNYNAGKNLCFTYWLDSRINSSINISTIQQLPNIILYNVVI